MSKSACTKWLDTLTDANLGNHSQSSLAHEAWNRGAAHAAQAILNHIEYVDTVHLAVNNCKDAATAIGKARIEADRFIVKVETNQLPADMPSADYDKWYAQSWIPGGVGCRVGPPYPFAATPPVPVAEARRFAQRVAMEIVDYHKRIRGSERIALIDTITDALTTRYNEGLEAGAKVAEGLIPELARRGWDDSHGHAGVAAANDIATAIRSLKEKVDP
jgi:hypothetical protein